MRRCILGRCTIGLCTGWRCAMGLCTSVTVAVLSQTSVLLGRAQALRLPYGCLPGTQPRPRQQVSATLLPRHHVSCSPTSRSTFPRPHNLRTTNSIQLGHHIVQKRKAQYREFNAESSAQRAQHRVFHIESSVHRAHNRVLNTESSVRTAQCRELSVYCRKLSFL